MAKKGPRSYPNTFWMILGTSKILIFFGPIIGHFWARGPRIYGFSYTKIPQIFLESLWEHLGKYYLAGCPWHCWANVGGELKHVLGGVLGSR